MATLLSERWNSFQRSLVTLSSSFLASSAAPPVSAPAAVEPSHPAPAQPGQHLPKPGELVWLDFRPAEARGKRRHDQSKPLRLLQWNIERGYKLAGVIKELQAVQADVIALQEIDVHNERSGWKDTGRLIAEALQVNYVLVCEFEELHSPLRNPASQGGGIHGNAILTRYDILEARAIEHRCRGKGGCLGLGEGDWCLGRVLFNF